ncbi:MAG: hypothetical protein H6821_05780 [Planctomycetaceae bacterium]|nr:hypothetical protein [Planctomycetales bacterium]MCB9873671.1 hypothetical protein [Planctomycetaceae bacterium]MCB9940923.1 hypothetical protein [Planctomycetaceae bacterium]HRX78219.1 hypothetical protein [Pirellulaceae bacterium]
MGRQSICCLAVTCMFVLSTRNVPASGPQTLPSLAEVRAIVDQHFRGQSQLQAGDIICQSEVRSLFPMLETAGWKVEDGDELLNRMLAPSDPLISILRSPAGTKFMRQVASDKLIYDRLDRIVQEPGGQRLLTDLVKLPDAARYAKHDTPATIPDLEDFLPKGRSGRARHVKDYDKPTEKIYTVDDLKKALQRSYELAQRRARP